MIDSSRPCARVDGISVVEIPNGLVVLVLPENQYHALDAATAAIWRLADGSHSIDAMARETGLAPEVVAFALGELADVGLLVAGEAPRLDRRMLLAKLTAAGIAVPVISSITAAGAEAALTCTNPCIDPACSGYCESGCGGPCSPFCPVVDPCACNPCSSIACPNYCDIGCGTCDPVLCPDQYDKCFCEGPCATGCGGQLCGEDCCVPPDFCDGAVCMRDPVPG
jgi:hypothetical protein